MITIDLYTSNMHYSIPTECKFWTVFPYKLLMQVIITSGEMSWTIFTTMGSTALWLTTRMKSSTSFQLQLLEFKNTSTKSVITDFLCVKFYHHFRSLFVYYLLLRNQLCVTYLCVNAAGTCLSWCCIPYAHVNVQWSTHLNGTLGVVTNAVPWGDNSRSWSFRPEDVLFKKK